MKPPKSLYEQLTDDEMFDNREELDINVQPDLYRFLKTAKRSALISSILFLLPIVGAIFYSSQVESTFVANAKLLFKAGSASALSSAGNREDSAVLSSLLGDQTPLTTQTELLLSRPVLQETIEEIGLTDGDGNLLNAEDIKETIETKIIGGTDVLQIKYEHTDPKIAVQLVNTLVKNYQEASLENRRSEMRKVKQFIVTEQLPRVEDNLMEAEIELRTFLENNDIISIDEETKAAVGTIGSMHKEIVGVKAAIEETRIRNSDLQTQLGFSPQEALAISRLSKASSVQSALSKLQDLNQEIELKRARYKSDSPVMQRLINEKELVNQLLDKEITTVLGKPMAVSDSMLYSDPIQLGLIEDYIRTELDYNSLRGRLNTLVSEDDNYQQWVRDLPRLNQKQRALERQLATTQETYNTLLGRLEEIQVQQDETINNSHLIEPAVIPNRPGSSKKTQVIALGVLAGTTLGVSATLLTSVLEPGI